MKSTFIAGGIVIIALIFGGIVYSRLKTNQSPTQTSETFAFTVKNDTVSGPSSLAASQGDKIIITLTADSDDELHLHGYDLKKEFKANEPVQLEFVANNAGRFELELENAKKTLGFLEVQPK